MGTSISDQPFARKALAVIMAVVLAVGLTPLPRSEAYADDLQAGGVNLAGQDDAVVLADGTYTVEGITSSISMYHFDEPAARVVVKGDDAWLITAIDGSGEYASTLDRFDGLAYGKQSEVIDPADETQHTLIAGTPVASVIEGDKYRTFVLPVDKDVVAAEGNIYYVLKYRAGYDAAHDGIWYKSKSNTDYYLSGYKLAKESDSTALPTDEAPAPQNVSLYPMNEESMFKVVKATFVTGDTVDTLEVALSGSNYPKLFAGTPKEKAAADETDSRWVTGVSTDIGEFTYTQPTSSRDNTPIVKTESGSKLVFALPVAKSDQKKFSVVAVAPSTSVGDTLRRFDVDLEAKTVTIGSRKATVEMTASSAVADVNIEATGTLYLAGYKNTMGSAGTSNEFTATPTITFKDSIYDAAYVTPLLSGDTPVPVAVQGGKLELPFVNVYSGTRQIADGVTGTVMMHVAADAPYEEAGTYVERTFTFGIDDASESYTLAISGDPLTEVTWLSNGIYALPNMTSTNAANGQMFNHMIPESRFLKIQGKTATIIFTQDGSTASVGKYSRLALIKSHDFIAEGSNYVPDTALPKGTQVVEGTAAGTNGNNTKWHFEIALPKADVQAMFADGSHLDITVWNNVGSSADKIPGWYRAGDDLWIDLGEVGARVDGPVALTNNVSMFKVASAELVGAGEDAVLKVTMGSDSFGKVALAKARKADDADQYEIAGRVVTLPISELASGARVTTSWWSLNKEEWYERDMTLDTEAMTLVFDNTVKAVDVIDALGSVDAVKAAVAGGTLVVTPELVDDMIAAIQVQYRDDNTDFYCAATKALWDALSDEQKEQVEEGGYFADDTGDASADDPLNQDGIGENEILVVSFGTSFNDSRAQDIGGVEKAIAEAYPGWSVRRAFTAQIIINHVQSRDGVAIDNMDQALARAEANGVKKLVVQPTHLMHGAEYDEMVEALAPYQGKMSISVAEPLLGEVGADGETVNADKEAVAKAVVEAAAVPSDTALVLMGHGTAHAANVTYTQMQAQMAALGYSNVFVGTVEGEPEGTDCESVIEAVKAAGFSKVVLRPLMVVAGDHANNDMADPEDDESWYSQFTADQAFDDDDVTCQIEGLGRIPVIQQLYVAHTGAVDLIKQEAANDVIANLPAEPTAADAEAVAAARAAYDALSDAEKAAVDEMPLLRAEVKVANAQLAEAEKKAEEASAAAKTAQEQADKAEADKETAKAAAKTAQEQAAKAEAAQKTAEANTKAAEEKAAKAEKEAASSIKANTMKVSTKKVNAKSNKKTTVKKSKAFKVSGAQGKVFFYKTSGSDKITVKKSGKVIVKSGLTAKKTYKVKVLVCAAGGNVKGVEYAPAYTTVTLKVNVK